MPDRSKRPATRLHQVIATVVLGFGVLGASARADAPPTLAGSQPNIILVLTDDQGMGDLSCMGNTVVRTPHIDQFYGQSTRFTDFQVSPTCSPTRAAIMSGRYPFGVGVTHTIFQRERMALGILTMPQALQSAGYRTGLFGKWHLGDGDDYLPQNRGFDEVLMHGAGGIGQVKYGDFPPNGENTYFDSVLLHNDTIVKTKGFCTDLFFDSALAWIKRQHGAGQPYFAYVSLNAPHAPLIAPEKYKKRFLELGYDQGTAGRYGMIENIDDNFGAMMATLREWKALDNTLVIFMTDNGGTHLKGKLNGKPVTHFNAGMRGAKNSPYEGGTHVPAFWYWEGVLEQGRDIETLTAHFDLYPTFAELVGAELPAEVEDGLKGRSLLPLLENRAQKLDWPSRTRFVHCGRWKPGQREEAKYKKAAVLSQRWRLVNNQALYDITSDPGETQDVSADHPDVVQDFRDAYGNGGTTSNHAWSTKTCRKSNPKTIRW